jgi:hypothetical protein
MVVPLVFPPAAVAGYDSTLGKLSGKPGRGAHLAAAGWGSIDEPRLNRIV